MFWHGFHLAGNMPAGKALLRAKLNKASSCVFYSNTRGRLKTTKTNLFRNRLRIIKINEMFLMYYSMFCRNANGENVECHLHGFLCVF